MDLPHKSMKSINKLKSKKGFSLVETLIAMTIVGVMLGMSIHYYRNYVEDANLARAKSDLSLIVQAASQYRAEKGYGALDTLNGKTNAAGGFCDTLTATNQTDPMGQPIGPWLGACPKPPHTDGVYTIIKTNEYVADAKYDYDGKTIKYSDLQ